MDKLLRDLSESELINAKNHVTNMKNRVAKDEDNDKTILTTTKKIIRQKSGTNDGPHKPSHHDFNIFITSNNNMQVGACMFSHQKHVGLFENKKDSKEAISMLIKEMKSSTNNAKEAFVNLIDKVMGSVTTKKIAKKSKGAKNGPRKPGFDDSNISTYSNNKRHVAMRMFGHQKHAGIFENKEDSKEAISELIKEMNSSTYNAKEEFVNLIDKVMGLVTTKKIVKKRKGASDGPCEPGFDDFNINTYSNDKKRIAMRMLGH